MPKPKTKKPPFDFAKFHETYSEEIEQIKSHSKTAELAYKFSPEDRKRVIELLTIAKDLPEKFLYNGRHCMHILLSMVTNTIDKELADELVEMFARHHFQSHHIESSIKAQLMRMRGF